MRGRFPPLILTGIALAIAYLSIMELPTSLPQALFKASAVTLFALHVWRHADPAWRGELTAVLAFGALGDFIIRYHLEAGGVTFIIGHLIAIRLYRRYPRTDLNNAQRRSIWALVPVTMVLAALCGDTAFHAFGFAVYGGIVAAMAASALLSRFPIGLTGLGAVTFVVSDLIIFAGIGPLHDARWPDTAIWTLYIMAQALIALGGCRAERLAPASGAQTA